LNTPPNTNKFTSNNFFLHEVLMATNKKFKNLNHKKTGPDQNPAVTASHNSVAYIESFWPYLANEILSDLDKLGTSITHNEKGETQRISSEELRKNFIEKNTNHPDKQHISRLASILSSAAVMQQVLSAATTNWAAKFDSNEPKCPLSFALDPEQYVSLRVLLPEKSTSKTVPESNAPTLVIGGTSTAVNLCWNFLYRMPIAYKEATGETLDRKSAKRVWSDTKDFLFKLGAGSLTAFVALASACSADTNELIWEGAADLSMEKIGGKFVWKMNGEMYNRYNIILKKIETRQNAHYVGCAALHARSAPLPLSEQWSDQPSKNGDLSIFSELLRWVTAVANKQYFEYL
jgi:hypothetical protein